MKKLLAVLAIFALALGTAQAQLSISVAPASDFALSIRNDSALVNAILANSPTVQTSFINGGLNFELIDNPALDSIVVGSGEFGSFFAKVSYVSKESGDPNNLGVTDTNLGFGVGGTTLYAHYDASSVDTSYFISAEQYSALNFWHYDENDSFSGNRWHDNPTYFRWYQAIDIENNLVKNVLRIDDRGSELIDHQDFIGTVEWNLNPVNDIVAVPEPSTYGLIGAAALLGMVAYRRNKRVVANL